MGLGAADPRVNGGRESKRQITIIAGAFIAMLKQCPSRVGDWLANQIPEKRALRQHEFTSGAMKSGSKPFMYENVLYHSLPEYAIIICARGDSETVVYSVATEVNSAGG
jgi:hypothetical protein